MERYLKAKLKNGRFDNVPLERSLAMGRIRGKGNRTTELRFRSALVRSRLRGWIMHPDLPGTPDFYFYRSRVAIFLDGCFWHGCTTCGHIPKTNRPFWRAKIERNRQRAARSNADLRRRGISVLRFWEHQIGEDLARLISKVKKLAQQRRIGASRGATH